MLSTLSLGCLAGLAAHARGQCIDRRLSHPTSFRVKVATQSMQNDRSYMEDFTQSADWSDDDQHPLCRSEFRLLAVFDGHGHHQVAEWLSANVKRFVGDAAISLAAEESAMQGRHQLVTPEQVARVLTKAFFSMDEELRQVSSDSDWANGGATGVVVMISQTHVVSANVGDSRALLWGLDTSRRNVCPRSIHHSLVCLTRDHTPDSTEERRRIERAEGFSVVVDGDACARIKPKGWDRPNLNLSRAFGDFHCKPFLDKPTENPVNVEPFVQVVSLKTVSNSWRSVRQRSFLLVLASDGVVNESFGNEEMVSATQDLLQRTWDMHVANESWDELRSAHSADAAEEFSWVAHETVTDRLPSSSDEEMNCSEMSSKSSGEDRKGFSMLTRRNSFGNGRPDDFLQLLPVVDWTRVAACLLRRTEDSNGGDNQSIHLAVLTQGFD